MEIWILHSGVPLIPRKETEQNCFLQLRVTVIQGSSFKCLFEQLVEQASWCRLSQTIQEDNGLLLRWWDRWDVELLLLILPQNAEVL